jgi:hypothetical protein
MISAVQETNSAAFKAQRRQTSLFYCCLAWIPNLPKIQTKEERPFGPVVECNETGRLAVLIQMQSRVGGSLRKVANHIISRRIQSLDAPESVAVGMYLGKSPSMSRPQVSSLSCTLMSRIPRQKAIRPYRAETRLLHSRFDWPLPMQHEGNRAIASPGLVSRWSPKQCPGGAPLPGKARQRRWQSSWGGEKEGWEWQYPFGDKAYLRGLVASVCAAAGASAHMQTQGASMSEAAAAEIVGDSAEGERAATPCNAATSSDMPLTKR